MVKEIRTTKNGHNLVEFEDDTGSIPVLFSNKNENVFNQSEKLIPDEVVGVSADKRGDLAIGNNITFPGVPRMPKVNSKCGKFYKTACGSEKNKYRAGAGKYFCKCG